MTATTAGIDAMITPADTALVRLTPNSMQIENMKLPRKDSRKTRPRVRARHRGFVGRPAQPVRHRQRRDAEAQPREQQHREGRDQRLGQRDVAADQRHAEGEAAVGDDARGREGGVQ